MSLATSEIEIHRVIGTIEGKKTGAGHLVCKKSGGLRPHRQFPRKALSRERRSGSQNLLCLRHVAVGGPNLFMDLLRRSRCV